MDNNLINILKDYGLTEKKSKIYLTLLKLGPNSASAISRNISENRTTDQGNKMKEKIEYLEFDIEAWRKLKIMLEGKIETLEAENKKLKEELKDCEQTVAHRDSFFSIMYDVLSNEDINGCLIEDILTAVIQGECGDDLTEKDKQIYDKFWRRDYV